MGTAARMQEAYQNPGPSLHFVCLSPVELWGATGRKRKRDHYKLTRAEEKRVNGKEGQG